MAVPPHRTTAGTSLGIDATPIDSRVSRWGGALPQYAVGHRARLERITVGLRPDDIVRLDGYLSRYADLLLAATGLDVRDVPGAGAAGGTTASVACRNGVVY